MTWNTFTKAISEAELESGTQAQILIKLFKRAGYINKKEDEISESTAKKWINGTRKCKIYSYFPEKENVDIQNIYKFFYNRPKDKLMKVQQIFCLEKDDNSPVDCETENMEKLCWSLVNQFLDLLGFEREDIPNIASGVDDVFFREHQGVAEERMSDKGVGVCTKEDKKHVSQDTAQPECMLNSFIRSFQDFGIQDFLDINPLEPIKPFRIEDTIQFIGRIDTNQKRKTGDILDGEKVYADIIKFKDILLEYIKYLKKHMKECSINNVLLYCICDVTLSDEFEEKTTNYRNQLKDLYQQIKIDIDEGRDEI